MSAGSVQTKATLHELVGELFPDYPMGIQTDALIELIDKAEEDIVNYSGRYTPAILHGISVLRDVRERVSEEDGNLGFLVRHNVDTVDFQLRNNLGKVVRASLES